MPIKRILYRDFHPETFFIKFHPETFFLFKFSNNIGMSRSFLKIESFLVNDFYKGRITVMINLFRNYYCERLYL